MNEIEVMFLLPVMSVELFDGKSQKRMSSVKMKNGVGHLNTILCCDEITIWFYRSNVNNIQIKVVATELE